MPRTPPTIVAPLPNDPRVFALAKASGLTTRESFAAAAEVWAWVSVMSVDDIVVNTAPDSLDAVVDIAGFGQAMLGAGLVGTVDGGLVLPAELRRRQSEQRRGGRAAADAEDQDHKRERERLGARKRKRKERATKALTKPAPKSKSPSPTAEDTGPKRTPCRLGEVEGYPVMLLFSRQGVPFYKLAGASPKEWTGTVTEPNNPSYADALVAIHAAMKREGGKGLGGGSTFRPSMQDMVTAAERYRDARASAAADAARRDEANAALLQASAEDEDDADQGSVERDCHAHVTPVTRDTVTVTVVSRSEGVTCPPNSREQADLENVTCHAPVTVPAPSSSNSLSASGNEDKENTTTTSVVTPRKRDHEDGILDRFFDRAKPQEPARSADSVEREQQLEQWRKQLAERFAAALGMTVDEVFQLRDTDKPALFARLTTVGIDPNTGLPFNADAPDKPAGARDDIGVTTEPIDHDKPAAGSVDVRGDAEFDCPAWKPSKGKSYPRLRLQLEQQGIPSVAVQSLPAEGDFEQQRVNVVNVIAAGA